MWNTYFSLFKTQVGINLSVHDTITTPIEAQHSQHCVLDSRFVYVKKMDIFLLSI
jgi:hypothetical protein